MDHSIIIEDVNFMINNFKIKHPTEYNNIFILVNEDLRKKLDVKIDDITKFIGNNKTMLDSYDQIVKNTLINLISYINDAHKEYLDSETNFRELLKRIHLMSKHISTITTPMDEFPKPSLNFKGPKDETPFYQSNGNWYYSDYQPNTMLEGAYNSLRVIAKISRRDTSSLLITAFIKNQYDLRHLTNIVPIYDLPQRDYDVTLIKAEVLHNELQKMKVISDKLKILKSNIMIYSIYSEIIMYSLRHNISIDTILLTAPKAYNVTIIAEARVGSTLIGHYNYYDFNKEPEEGSTYRWLRSDTIDGEYKPLLDSDSITYVTSTMDADKYLRFEVTPRNAFEPKNGEPVLSDPIRIYP